MIERPNKKRKKKKHKMLALYKITNKQALFQQGAVWGKI